MPEAELCHECFGDTMCHDDWCNTQIEAQAKLAKLGSEPVNPSGLGAEMDDLMEFEPPSDKAYGVPPPAYAIGDVVAVRETIRLVTPKGNYLTGGRTCSTGRATQAEVAPWRSAEWVAAVEELIEAAERMDYAENYSGYSRQTRVGAMADAKEFHRAALAKVRSIEGRT